MAGGGGRRDGRSSVRQQLRRGAESFDYRADTREVAHAVRAHQHAQRALLQPAVRVPLRLDRILTRARDGLQPGELIGPLVLGSVIDGTVAGSRRARSADGVAWRCALHGIEMAWLSRLAAGDRDDPTVASMMFAPVIDLVATGGPGAAAIAGAATAAPVWADRRHGGRPVPLRSSGIAATAVAGGIGLRVLARDRARLAERAIKRQIVAAAATGRADAASLVAGHQSHTDLLEGIGLEPLVEAGRADLIEEAIALGSLRARLEQGVGSVRGSDAPEYVELSAVLASAARRSCGSRPAPTPAFAYLEPRHATSVLTRAQRDQLWSRLEGRLTFDEGEHWTVTDLRHPTTTGGQLTIVLRAIDRQLTVQIDADDRTERPPALHGVSTLALLMQVPWAVDRSGARDSVFSAPGATGVRLAAMLLAARWYRMAPRERCVALGGVALLAADWSSRHARGRPWWARGLGAASLAGSVAGTAVISRSFGHLDDRLAQAHRRARERARLTAQYEESSHWLGRARQLHTQIAAAVQQGPRIAEQQRLQLEVGLGAALHHLEVVDAEVRRLQGLLLAAERPPIGRTAHFVVAGLASALRVAARYSPTLVVDLATTAGLRGGTPTDRAAATRAVLDAIEADGRFTTVLFLSGGPPASRPPGRSAVQVVVVSRDRPLLAIAALRRRTTLIRGATVYGGDLLTDGLLARAVGGIWVQPAWAAEPRREASRGARAIRTLTSAAVDRRFRRTDLEPLLWSDWPTAARGERDPGQRTSVRVPR